MNRPICQCWTLKMIFSPIKNAVLIYKAINYQAFIAITHNISFSISFKSTTAPAITQMQKRLAFVPALMFYTRRRLLKFLAIFSQPFSRSKTQTKECKPLLCGLSVQTNKKRGFTGHDALVHIAQSLRFHSTRSDSEVSQNVPTHGRGK